MGELVELDLHAGVHPEEVLGEHSVEAHAQLGGVDGGGFSEVLEEGGGFPLPVEGTFEGVDADGLFVKGVGLVGHSISIRGCFW